MLNTEDLEDFCVIGLKSLGKSTVSLHAVSGKRARLARKNAEELGDDMAVFKKTYDEHLNKVRQVTNKIFCLYLF